MVRTMTNKETGSYCQQGQRITALEEKVTTIFHNQERLERTLDKLDDTQDALREEIAKLNKTLTILQWIIVVGISAIGLAKTLGII